MKMQYHKSQSKCVFEDISHMIGQVKCISDTKKIYCKYLRWHNPAYFFENLYLYIFVLSFIWSDGDLSSSI